MVVHKHLQEKTAEMIPLKIVHILCPPERFFDKNALFLTKLSSISTNGVIVVDNDDGGDDDDDNGDDGLIHQPALKTDWGEPSECFPHLLQIFRTCVRGTICNVKQLPGQLHGAV